MTRARLQSDASRSAADRKGLPSSGIENNSQRREGTGSPAGPGTGSASGVRRAGMTKQRSRLASSRESPTQLGVRAGRQGIVVARETGASLLFVPVQECTKNPDGVAMRNKRLSQTARPITRSEKSNVEPGAVARVFRNFNASRGIAQLLPHSNKRCHQAQARGLGSTLFLIDSPSSRTCFCVRR